MRALCLPLAAAAAILVARPAAAAQNFLTHADWWYVFPQQPYRAKVNYGGQVYKDPNAGNTFDTRVDFYWVDPTNGGTIYDSFTQGSVDADDPNRLNYGLAWTTQGQIPAQGWKCRTKAQVITGIGIVTVWSAVTTPQ